MVNLNTRQSAVLAALLSKTFTQGLAELSPANVSSFASAMTNATTASPLTNRSQLIDLVASDTIAQAGDKAKESREAAIRTLGEVGQTRTWNLLIDVVAQVGKVAGGTSDGNFVIEGERRYCVHVAIDRVTGRVVDRQIESPGE